MSELLKQYWFDVGPPSQTVAQYQTNIAAIPGVCQVTRQRRPTTVKHWSNIPIMLFIKHLDVRSHCNNYVRQRQRTVTADLKSKQLLLSTFAQNPMWKYAQYLLNVTFSSLPGKLVNCNARLTVIPDGYTVLILGDFNSGIRYFSLPCWLGYKWYTIMY